MEGHTLPPLGASQRCRYAVNAQQTAQDGPRAEGERGGVRSDAGTKTSNSVLIVEKRSKAALQSYKR